MGLIAVIRRDASDQRGLVEALRLLGHAVADVSTLQQIDIGLLSLSGQIQATLDGLDVQAIDRIVFCGMPSQAEESELDHAEHEFVYGERHASLIALLHMLRRKVLNPGPVLSLSSVFPLPSYQIRRLARIGWATPSIRTRYSFTSETFAKTREPEPLSGAKYFLVITGRILVVHPFDQVIFDDQPRVALLVERTRQFMLAVDAHWMTIPVYAYPDRTYAYGLSTVLPDEVGTAEIADLLHDCIR